MNTIIKAYSLSECMEAMSSYALAFEQAGEKNLIFCEDRLTLIAERELVRRTGGTFRSSVTTFSRFLNGNERSISKQGSVMAIGDVMTRLQRENKLQCFTSITGVGNNAKCIYETLAQFFASEITPDLLKESATKLPDDTLKKKISDLAFIYEEYTNFLQRRELLDESKYLSLLPRKICEDKNVKESTVFFLCYTSFTAQALQTVHAVLQNAKNVVGIFVCGEEDIYTNSAFHAFSRVCGQYGKTKVLQLGEPLIGNAEMLRKSLYNPEKTTAERMKTDAVRVFEAQDKTDEAEYVAVQIRRLLNENEGMRYRDVAVLVPNVTAYSLSLKRAFGEFDIPYFIDEKRSLKRHPLSRFLLDCFRVAREKYSPVAVQSLTQNFFFGESDEYRNYLLKFANYRGGAKREIKTGEAVESVFSIDALREGRKKLLLATQSIKPKMKGREYCDAVREILQNFQVEENLEKLEEQFDDVSQKGYLAQIYRALDGVLFEAELLTGDRDMTVAEFSAVLTDGLDATEISLIPLKSDAVFIGDIVDSRIEKVRAVFAMGMTDEVPRSSNDSAIVSDKEIAKLAQVQALIEPTVAQVNLRSRESVCLNLCTFLTELHLSYPLSADGSEPAVSDVLHYIDEAFCSMDGRDIPRLKKLPIEQFQYQCSAPAPAVRQLLIEKQNYEVSKMDTRQKYSSLYTALDKLGVQEKDDYLIEQGGQVRVERGEDLFFHNGKISPTALESYFSCPFRNYVERGLKLKEREETAVLAVDTGNFIHELLQITAKKSAEISTEEEMRAFALAQGKKILQKPIYATQADTASGLFFADKLLAEGAEVAVVAFRQIKNSSFVVEETEKTISTNEFQGKVDRVDGTEKYVRIIDYKTGSIDDAALSYYTGRKLQMQLYMSALKGERVPAGVFYFPASVDYTEDTDNRFKMKGFLNGDEEALRCGDSTLTEEKPSEFFPASLKDNGRSKRVMPESVFRDFLDYSVLVARQGCNELKEGFIAPSPFDKGCEYCKYGGMCGFNRDSDTPRTESAIDPSTIAEIARKTRDGKEE